MRPADARAAGDNELFGDQPRRIAAFGFRNFVQLSGLLRNASWPQERRIHFSRIPPAKAVLRMGRCRDDIAV